MALAEDPLSPPDATLVPAAREAVAAAPVRPALAGQERVLAEQAAARLGAAGAEVAEPEEGNPPAMFYTGP